MMKTAVILAAGKGSRFGQYIEKMPKGFIEVGGKAMILRSIDILLSCGIERILIGTGYLSEMYEGLKATYPMVETCYCPRYAETNSMFTLLNCREAIGGDDFLLLESDLIFEKKAIEVLQECPEADVMLATSLTKFQDQYFVEYNDENVLTACSIHEEELQVKGEMVGIHKLSNAFYQKMCDDYGEFAYDQPDMAYKYELLRMSRCVAPLHVLNVPDLNWYELDDVNDLKYAEEKVVARC